MSTQKEYINENNHLLTQRDDIYIHRQTFHWGITHIREINPADVYEVYDLVNSMFFYKQALPFEPMGGSQEGHFLFKQLNGSQAQTDLSTLFSRVATMSDILVFFVEYPNEYNIKNKLLILCDRNEYNALTPERKEVYITMNAYINLIQRKCHVYRIPTDDIAPLTDPFHWVWFRKEGSHFKKEQMRRVQSWIQLNKGIQFVLWTDMEDEQELRDFFSKCNPGDVEPFLNGTVAVQYRAQTVQFVRDYLSTYKEDRAIRLFDKANFIKIIEERDNSEIIIAKTDFLRAMILHARGGFYADFNDCQCLIPLRYWMKELFNTQEIIWPSDTSNPNQISNYFLYVPKGSKKFERYHYNTIAGFSGLWNLVKNPQSKIKLNRMFIDMTRKFIKKLKENPTNKPCKLIVETILPVYGGGKFASDISSVMGKQVLKGIEHCDPRGRIFMSVFPLEFLAKKTGDRIIEDFYEYMAAEFLQIGSISLKRTGTVNMDGKMTPGKQPDEGDKFDIKYLNPHYHEEYDDMDRLVPKLDKILEGLETLYDDLEAQEYIYHKYRINMSLSIVSLTNIILQNDAKLTMSDVVPFSYVFMSFCYLSLVLHWGDGTSMGVLMEDEE